MDDKFYEAAIPEPWTILGLRLKPFSLGHVFILHRVGSAFFTPNTPIDPGQITMAVAVCANGYKENLEMLDDPNLIRKVCGWADKLTGNHSILCRAGWRKERVIDWDEKAKMLLAYFGDMENVPTYSERDESTTSQVNLPTAQVIKVTLMKHMHFEEMYLMDRPWAYCVWDYISLKAMEGQVNVYDLDELNAARAKADELAEKFNKKGKG